MATTYQSAAVLANNAFKTLGVFARTFTYTTPVFVIADIVEMLPVFEGETVLQLEIRSTDLDTNASPLITLDIGDGTVDDRFLAADTVAQAGGLAVCGLALPYQYPADDTIDVTVLAAPATGVVGSFTVTALIQAA